MRRVSLVIVPRERFSFALPSLDDVLAHTSFPCEIVYVDGGAPRAVRRGFATRARTHGFTLVGTGDYLTPNQARNLGRSAATGEYIVFLDNDALVEPGWLARLVACADDTGAAICTPLCLFRYDDGDVVHAAGGLSRIEERNGIRTYREEPRWVGRPIADVRPLLVRAETELAEFHCMLIRREILDRFGPLDEQLRGVNEHTDLGLRVRAAGGTMVLEPASVVVLVPPVRLTWSDTPYYLRRWSQAWVTPSLAHFATTWGLAPDDPGLESTRGYATYRRRLVFPSVRRLVGYLPGPALRVLRPAERTARRAAVRLTGLAGTR
jgi:GT2 family glycosyltransferase